MPERDAEGDRDDERDRDGGAREREVLQRLAQHEVQVVADEPEGVDDRLHAQPTLARVHGVSRRCTTTSTASVTSASSTASTPAAMNWVLKPVWMALRSAGPASRRR